MNKMDLNMPPNNDDKKAGQGFGAVVKNIAIFAAPALVLVGGIALAITLANTGPKAEEKNGPSHAPSAQFAVATARASTIAVTAQGEARPRIDAALAAQVAGRIVWAAPAYVEGGAFRQGETLVRIDPADYQLAVTRARSQVAQAEEALAREQAEAELARQDWAVLGQGDPSPLAVREPQLAQARASLAAAQAQLRAAELDLERTNVSAPFAGRVRERHANVGDYVGPGAAIANVFSTDVVEIRVALTDANLASLQTPVGYSAGANSGPRAQVNLISGGQTRQWTGRLVRTEATIDPRTRLVYGVVEVRDPFNNSAGAPLAPGMFVSVRIEGQQSESMVAAPRSALKRDEFVYVVKPDNTIEVRSVRAAQTTDDEVLFRGGVAAGERLVVSTLPGARNGMEVTPIGRDGRAAAPAPSGAAQPSVGGGRD